MTIHHLVAWCSHDIKLQWFKLARISISYHSHQNGISSGWWLSPTLKNMTSSVGIIIHYSQYHGKVNPDSIHVPVTTNQFFGCFHGNQYQSSFTSRRLGGQSGIIWDLRTNQQRRSPEWSPKGGSHGLLGGCCWSKTLTVTWKLTIFW